MFSSIDLPLVVVCWYVPPSVKGKIDVYFTWNISRLPTSFDCLFDKTHGNIYVVSFLDLTAWAMEFFHYDLSCRSRYSATTKFGMAPFCIFQNVSWYGINGFRAHCDNLLISNARVSRCYTRHVFLKEIQMWFFIFRLWRPHWVFSCYISYSQIV